MNLATEIKRIHKAVNKVPEGVGVIVPPLSDKAKEYLKEERYIIGEAETPCGCGTFNTVSK